MQEYASTYLLIDVCACLYVGMQADLFTEAQREGEKAGWETSEEMEYGSSVIS